jgi:hypothetical protein
MRIREARGIPVFKASRPRPRNVRFALRRECREASSSKVATSTGQGRRRLGTFVPGRRVRGIRWCAAVTSAPTEAVQFPLVLSWDVGPGPSDQLKLKGYQRPFPHHANWSRWANHGRRSRLPARDGQARYTASRIRNAVKMLDHGVDPDIHRRHEHAGIQDLAADDAWSTRATTESTPTSSRPSAPSSRASSRQELGRLSRPTGVRCRVSPPIPRARVSRSRSEGELVDAVATKASTPSTRARMGAGKDSPNLPWRELRARSATMAWMRTTFRRVRGAHQGSINHPTQ